MDRSVYVIVITAIRGWSR